MSTDLINIKVTTVVDTVGMTITFRLPDGHTITVDIDIDAAEEPQSAQNLRTAIKQLDDMLISVLGDAITKVKFERTTDTILSAPILMENMEITQEKS